MKIDIEQGLFGALKESLGAVSSVITSAGIIPADAPSGSLFLSTEKTTASGGGECTVSFKIRYFSPKMTLGDDGAIHNAIERIMVDGVEVEMKKYECCHCGRYFDVVAVYAVPASFFESELDGSAASLMQSLHVKITFV